MHACFIVNTSASTHISSVNMDTIDDAIAELRASTSPNIAAVARRYGLNQSMLSQRFNSKCCSRRVKAEVQRVLNDEQEQRLIDYNKKQTELCLPPSPAIVSNIASELAALHLARNGL